MSVQEIIAIIFLGIIILGMIFAFVIAFIYQLKVNQKRQEFLHKCNDYELGIINCYKESNTLTFKEFFSKDK